MHSRGIRTTPYTHAHARPFPASHNGWQSQHAQFHTKKVHRLCYGQAPRASSFPHTETSCCTHRPRYSARDWLRPRHHDDDDDDNDDKNCYHYCFFHCCYLLLRRDCNQQKKRYELLRTALNDALFSPAISETTTAMEVDGKKLSRLD